MASTRMLYEPVVTKCHNTHLSPDEPNLLGTVDFSRPNLSAERTELDRVYTAGPSVVLSTPSPFPFPFPFLSYPWVAGKVPQFTTEMASHHYPRSGLRPQLRALDGRTDHQLHRGSHSLLSPRIRGDCLAAALWRAPANEIQRKAALRSG